MEKDYTGGIGNRRKRDIVGEREKEEKREKEREMRKKRESW